MEPAVERREHTGRRMPWWQANMAAMEPAVERREHVNNDAVLETATMGRNGARR